MSSIGGPLTSGFSAYTPYMPPINPYVMPPSSFDALLANYGIDLTWQKSHFCPCTYGGAITGSPDPQCNTCKGLGWYWDSASAVWRGLITFIHMSPTPDEPGTIMDPKFGVVQMSEPTLTIPSNGPEGLLPNIYAQSSINDVYTMVNAIDRYEAALQVGGVQTVPYQQKLTIPATGAVTVYDQPSNTVITVSGYTVSGPTVTLPSQYPAGTAYVVSYTAAKAFVAWRIAGTLGHDRPLGNAALPKRFRLQALDLWLRTSGKM